MPAVSTPAAEALTALLAAYVDPALAKQQLLLLAHERYMDPRGRLPAYEYDFGDVNPPVHALAAMRVFVIDGGRDLTWLTKVFNKLLVNFAWWMNRVDVDGKDLFAGGARRRAAATRTARSPRRPEARRCR